MLRIRPLFLRVPTKFQIQAKARAEDIAERLGTRLAKGKQEQEPMSESEEPEEGDEGISEIVSNEDVNEMEVDEVDEDEDEDEGEESEANVPAKVMPILKKVAPKPQPKVVAPVVRKAIPPNQLGSRVPPAPTAASSTRQFSKPKASGDISKPYVLRADSQNVVIYPTRLNVNSSTAGNKQSLFLETSAVSYTHLRAHET